MVGEEPRSQDRISQRALKLFATKGYDATSVREICAAAAITKPTLYHFFGSKEGLYRALVDGTLEDLRRELRSRLEEPVAPIARLRAVACLYFDFARARRDLMRFIWGLIYAPPSSAPPTDFHRYYDEVVGLIGRVVEEGVARRELSPGPTDLRMLVYMGTLGEAVTGYLLVGHPEPTPELAHALVDTILEGWRPAR